MFRAAAIACCLILSTTAEARPRVACDTLGVHLVLCSNPAEGEVVSRLREALVPQERWPAAYREVALRPDLDWVSFIVLHDSTQVWPGGLPVLYVPERLVPVKAFAVGAALDPLPLGLLNPDELWRRRWPCAKSEVGSVVFAGYRTGRSEARNATRIRLESGPRLSP